MSSQPTVFLDSPSSSLFKFFPLPANEPLPIPPPHFDYPFTIPDSWYQGALDFRVPITIATLYAVTAKLLNKYNLSTGKKPWAISKTAPFRLFVVLHNVFLAVYSAWTFWGMLTALRASIESPMGPNGLAGTVDSFCKFHGPGGFGNGVAFNGPQGKWETFGNGYLTSEGTPSRIDAGRLWNEGLAFYGWIFYLSKFYEVLDTFIILAKGKLSSTLQTYHHAGAMMCMWAGIRFMSVPIWMFVFVNSGIHAMMYTYYTVTAFNIRVPTAIKRTLTTLQITQFLVGASYAMVHSFVYYTVPVKVAVPKPAAVVASSVAAAATDAASAGSVLSSIKNMVFGAAEAANANVIVSSNAASAGAGSGHGLVYQTQYQTVPCVTSSGSTFAIWLNVLYLAPLTYLFVSFFIASYIKRSNAEAERVHKQKKLEGADRRLSNAMMNAEKAGWEAAKGVEREIYNQGGDSAVVDDENEGAGEKSYAQALRTRNTRSSKRN
ncbi:GNS1/SUR4 family protein [Apiospora hydei]|uniref:Elongation of fatty acids protein n=1 Tax=Apiospora hydei TaxID=1337664 RepID=A0ABR1X3L2_9PEZI